MYQYHHSDVLIERVCAHPANAKEIPAEDRILLAHGIYRVSAFGLGTQREYTQEEIRHVAD